MRSRALVLVAVLVLFVVACSDLGVTPNDSLQTAPTLQMSHVGGEPGDATVNDLCGGLSPCDAFDYDRNGDGVPDGTTGVPGMCFLPPTVDNHLSDPACSGDFVPGLDGLFKLAWCQVDYAGGDGTKAPTIHIPVNCQDEADWQDLVQDPNGAEHYSTSVRWRKNGNGSASVGDVFRLYIVHGALHYAHRDVVIDPNLTTPADGFVHSIGFGTEPIKVRITEGLGCVFFDTQASGTNNAATCVIAGETTFSFFKGEVVQTKFNFPDGNPPFIADFEVSECLSLGFESDGADGATGNALVDVPLADCMISMNSLELDELTVPGQIDITVNDIRWATGSFENARLNVLQMDTFGVATLPPHAAPIPNWFGKAGRNSAVLRWIENGLGRLAALFGIKPAYGFGAGWDFTRMSDFQVALMPVMVHDATGTDCAVPVDSCLNLGTFPGVDPIDVSVKVSAPDNTGRRTYPTGHFPVPGTRLHFFPSPATGSVTCITNVPADAVCVPANTLDYSTTPTPSMWDHLVVLTGKLGTGSVKWNLAGGPNTLNVVACGVARPGGNEADPPGEPGADGVWGMLGDCTDRFAAIEASDADAEALDNGPADGLTPFEPVDTFEVAIYGLPLTFEAKTCPQITVDGIKGERDGIPEWDECVTPIGFIAPLKGKKSTTDNAWLYTYTDGTTLYMALEVITKDLGNKMFINLVESFEGNAGVAAAGDELLVIDFGDLTAHPLGEFSDWHFTDQCVGNNSSSLCGDPDVRDDKGFDAAAAARVDGAGLGRVFYEFSRPLGSPGATAGPDPYDPTKDLDKEDLNAASGAKLGLRLRVTQGKGGGKGGFVFPDPQKDLVYHIFLMQ